MLADSRKFGLIWKESCWKNAMWSASHFKTWKWY